MDQKLEQTTLEQEQAFQAVIEHVINYTKSDQGSGIMKQMQPRFVSCNLAQKEITIAYQVEEWELNPQGSMHGGLLCAAFDNAFGMITHYFAEDNFITTVDLATRFLKPIPMGSELTITVKVRSNGRTLVSLTGEAYVNQELLAATSSSTFMILRGKKTQINNLKIQN